MSEIKKTDRTTITRMPKRGVYDRDVIYSILDEALFCNLAYVSKGQPFQIPTGFCRIGDKLFIHGSVGSHYMRELASKKLPVNISATIMDGLVLARSAFHHSVNYRSVIMFSQPELVTDQEDLYKFLEAFTEKMCPGRWNDIRQPNPGEWKATMVIGFSIQEASAKVRTGQPIDDDDDYELGIWAGVMPLKLQKQTLVPDPALKSGVKIPDYLL